jgi:hypothetical protein
MTSLSVGPGVTFMVASACRRRRLGGAVLPSCFLSTMLSFSACRRALQRPGSRSTGIGTQYAAPLGFGLDGAAGDESVSYRLTLDAFCIKKIPSDQGRNDACRRRLPRQPAMVVPRDEGPRACAVELQAERRPGGAGR